MLRLQQQQRLQQAAALKGLGGSGAGGGAGVVGGGGKLGPAPAPDRFGLLGLLSVIRMTGQQRGWWWWHVGGRRCLVGCADGVGWELRQSNLVRGIFGLGEGQRGGGAERSTAAGEVRG